MKENLIFVGLNPGKAHISKINKGSSHRRFNTWLEYLNLKHVSFTNLSPDPDWDFKFKTFDHNLLKDSIQNCNKIVAWGSKVSSYLKRLGFIDHFVLPHPSGLNRQLNDPMYVQRKLDECKIYIYQ